MSSSLSVDFIMGHFRRIQEFFDFPDFQSPCIYYLATPLGTMAATGAFFSLATELNC